MKRTTGNVFYWQITVRSMVMTAMVAIVELLAMAQTPGEPSGIRNSASARRLSDKQLQQVREALARKSGFVELSFDAQGALTLGSRQHVTGGSATARALLVAALDGDDLFELESHDRSSSVAFAQIYQYQDRVISETRKRSAAFQVQVDFEDFNSLSGSNEAKAAFDLGLALLHELTHGVLRLQDTDIAGQIGDCDAHVNQIRRELQLPERMYYQPNITVVQASTGKRLVVAQLEFVAQTAGNQTKYRLSWMPGNVSPNARNVAQLEQGLVKAR